MRTISAAGEVDAEQAVCVDRIQLDLLRLRLAGIDVAIDRPGLAAGQLFEQLARPRQRLHGQLRVDALAEPARRLAPQA